MPIKQDDAEECLGEMFVSDMILNNLEVEEILRVDCIQELNEGCNIDLKSDSVFHHNVEIKGNLEVYLDVGISGCLFLNQPLLNLKNDSGYDDKDIGFYSSYLDTGVTKYTGLIRDVNATDKPFIFFDNAINPPIDVCGELDLTGITYPDVKMGGLELNRSLEDCGLTIAGTQFGDLMVGTTASKFNRLPIGTPGEVLITDLTSPLGAKWSNTTIVVTNDINLCNESGTYHEKIADNFNYIRLISNITLIGEEKYTRLFRKKYYGARNYSVINELEDGPMGFFNVTKSSRNIDGHIAKLTGIAGYTGGLKSKWTRRVNIELGKCNIKSDGDYLAIQNYDTDCALVPELVRSTISLSGTSYTEIESSTKGNFIFQVENDIQGPVGIFYLTKNIPGNAASISRVSHSPSSDFNKLEMRWLANSGIELHKTKSTFDGDYNIIPIHDQYLNETITTLSGIAFASDIYIEDYERIVTIVSVENIVAEGPSAIFAISKNHITNKFHVVVIVSTHGGGGWDNLEIICVDPPSISSGDPCVLVVDDFEIVGLFKPCGLSGNPFKIKILLTWDADDVLKLRKNADFFDGDYKVRIYNYFPC